MPLPLLTRWFAPLGVIMMLGVGCAAEDDPGSTPPSPITSAPATTTAPSSSGESTPEPTPSATPADPVELLPDLRSMPAYDVHIELDGDDRLLRFSSTLANVGAGPLEVRPNDDQSCPDGQRFATQVIYLGTDDGSSNIDDDSGDSQQTTTPAGCMVDHPEHEHWHFDASARYVLTAPREREPIVSADKVSFCLRDSHPISAQVDRQAYGDCDRESTQGISAGWGDEYSHDLDGQALPLPSDLTDGRYCLTLAADPDELLRESDDTNNATTVGVRITGDQARAVAPTNCVPLARPTSRHDVSHHQDVRAHTTFPAETCWTATGACAR